MPRSAAQLKYTPSDPETVTLWRGPSAKVPLNEPPSILTSYSPSPRLAQEGFPCTTDSEDASISDPISATLSALEQAPAVRRRSRMEGRKSRGPVRGPLAAAVAPM